MQKGFHHYQKLEGAILFLCAPPSPLPSLLCPASVSRYTASEPGALGSEEDLLIKCSAVPWLQNRSVWIGATVRNTSKGPLVHTIWLQGCHGCQIWDKAAIGTGPLCSSCQEPKNRTRLQSKVLMMTEERADLKSLHFI